jgi:hypothetical protein
MSNISLARDGANVGESFASFVQRRTGEQEESALLYEPFDVSFLTAFHG